MKTAAADSTARAHEQYENTGRDGIPEAATSAHIGAAANEHDFEALSALPEDHTAWPSDAIEISAQAQTALAALPPYSIPSMGFWDHERQAVATAGGAVLVDPAGSYRLIKA